MKVHFSEVRMHRFKIGLCITGSWENYLTSLQFPHCEMGLITAFILKVYEKDNITSSIYVTQHDAHWYIEVLDSFFNWTLTLKHSTLDSLMHNSFTIPFFTVPQSSFLPPSFNPTFWKIQRLMELGLPLLYFHGLLRGSHPFLWDELFIR